VKRKKSLKFHKKSKVDVVAGSARCGQVTLCFFFRGQNWHVIKKEGGTIECVEMINISLERKSANCKFLVSTSQHKTPEAQRSV
jgi:hypothetical protein